MNKKLIRNTILFVGMAGVSTTTYMVNTEAKSSPVSINSYNAKSQIVDIPDANLKKGINNALKRGEVLTDITIEDMESLKSLTINGKNISNIKGLEYATNLTTLNLNNNQIQDTSALNNLTNLTTLYLNNNQISNILSLENLTKLTYLNISNNKIDDISFLSNLTSLTNLNLSYNKIRDISSLSNLTNLTRLNMESNQFSDITHIKYLVNLTWLEFHSAKVENISALSTLINLKTLYISSNQIRDISPLENLTKLTTLYLNNNQISDISALRNLTNLTILSLGVQNIFENYTIKTNIEPADIHIDNPIKDLNNNSVNMTYISNSGYFKNNKIYWDDVVLGQNKFTSKFSQDIQINTAKATFSGTITYNIDVVDGEGPTVDNEITINEEDFTLSATITAEDLLSDVDYLIHKGERHSLPYSFNYDVFNRENNIVEVYDTVGNVTEYEVTADLLDLETINSLLALLEENENSPEIIAYIRAITNNMSESANKDLLNDKINNLSFDMTLDRLSTSANVDIYIKCENLLSMTLDTNMITFENYSSAEDMEKSEAISIRVNSSLPYQLNAYLPVDIQNADGTKALDRSIFNIKESSEDEYKKFTSIGSKVVLKDNCEKGNALVHLIDLKLSSDSAHDADVYKTTIKFEIEQK